MIYQDVIERVENGEKFYVDFKNRKLTVSSKEVELTGDLGIEKIGDLQEWLDKLEDLYDNYKYSRPTKRSMSRRKSRFRALSVEEMVAECGHDALSNPVSRDVAQAELELFILFSLINGSFDPKVVFAVDWFFQGSDKDLILLKDWF